MENKVPRWAKFGDAEALPIDTERLARLWLEEAAFWAAHRSQGDPTLEESEWQWVSPAERLDRLVGEDKQTAWHVLLRLVELADDSTLPRIGAGPLEDFLREHGSEFVEVAERLAESDGRFRTALKHVWGWASMPKGVWDRISRAAGRRP